jgi:hypothetical protein
MKAWISFALALVVLGLGETSRAASPPEDANADSAAGGMKVELHHLSEAVIAAKKPEDLDAVLEGLQKYQGGVDPAEFTREDRALFQQLNGAMEFVKTWQNYLMHLNSGQADLARNDLSNLSQNNTGIGIVPRSKILELLAGGARQAVVAPSPAEVSPEVADVQKILDGIDSLDAMEPALKQLYALEPGNRVAPNTAKDLAPLVEVYGDLKAGLPTTVNLNFMGDPNGPGISVKVNRLLLNFILQHYFDTYTGPAPGNDETPPAYTERVKTAAMAAQDWALLRKALVAHEYLVRNVAAAGGSGEPDDEAAGLNRMIDGINQETAGQYALAVASYQNALKSGSLDIPAKLIGERLDRIKREHPQEFDSGMAAFLTPPMPNFPGRNTPFYNPAMFNRPQSGAGNPNAPARPSPVISIPGAKSTTDAPAPPATNAAPLSK